MPPRFTYNGSDVNDRSFTSEAWAVIRSRGAILIGHDWGAQAGYGVVASEPEAFECFVALHLEKPELIAAKINAWLDN